MKNITTQEITCADERAAHGRVRWQKQNRGHDAASAGAGRCPQPSAGPASAQPGGQGAGLPKGEGHWQERLPFAQGALVPGWAREKGAGGLAEAASRAGGVLGRASAGRWVSKLLPRASGRGSVTPLLARLPFLSSPPNGAVCVLCENLPKCGRPWACVSDTNKGVGLEDSIWATCHLILISK